MNLIGPNQNTLYISQANLEQHVNKASIEGYTLYIPVQLEAQDNAVFENKNDLTDLFAYIVRVQYCVSEGKAESEQCEIYGEEVIKHLNKLNLKATLIPTNNSQDPQSPPENPNYGYSDNTISNNIESEPKKTSATSVLTVKSFESLIALTKKILNNNIEEKVILRNYV